MKLALLGADPAMLAVASAAVEQPGNWFVGATEAPSAATSAASLVSRLPLRDDWEFLLSPNATEGVLVARDPNQDLRADQLRKVIQAGVPLLISHPLFDSMLICYELDMIRRESGCRMLPYLPARWHPAVAQLLQLANESPLGIGPWQQLTLERQVESPSRERVLSQFAVDVDLCRALVGELTHVSAWATGSEDMRYANLSVQLSGPANIGVRWLVRTDELAFGATLKIVAPAGRAELLMPANGGWSLDVWRGDQRTSQSFEPWDPALEALAQFKRLIAGDAAFPTWLDACRSVELTETIDRSLRRGRTIELHFDEYSEHGTFKGLMTSMGCGLLVSALLIMLLAALAGRLGLPVAQHWASFLLLLFGGFLALQALRLVFRTKS